MQIMILVNLLVLSMLISFSKSTPYRRREAENVLLDFADPAGSENYFSYSYPDDYETQKPKTENSLVRISRAKKMGSLSISNPMDVLRQRFILELARREQLQQQQQIKANRELLQGIGKRSAQHHDKIYPSIETRDNQFYQRKNIGNQESSNYPNWSRMDWAKIGNSDDRINEDEQSSKMGTNERNLL